MCVFITDIVYYPNKNTDAFKPVQAGQRDLSNQALFAALFKHDNQFSVPLFRISLSSAAILNARFCFRPLLSTILRQHSSTPFQRPHYEAVTWR